MAEEKSSADLVAQVQAGYTFDGQTLELGALLVDGETATRRPRCASRWRY